MDEQKPSNVALEKRLGTVEGTVRRLVDLDHRSHIGQMESTLEVFGRRLVVAVRAAQVAEASEADVWMLHPPEAGGLFASSVRVILMHLDTGQDVRSGA